MNLYYSIFLILMFAGCTTISEHNQLADSDSSIEHRKGVIWVKAAPNQEVVVKQQKHEFWFGSAIGNQVFDGRMSPADVARFKTLFLENFNSAVTENALKWMNMQPTRENLSYDTVNAMLEWSEANDIPLRGHNIFWGVYQFVQPWLKELNNEELYAEVENRAKDIASKYKGRFAHYDLNNEMIHGNFYADRLGSDITLKMANWVKAEDPSSKIYLNDYNILTGKELETFIVHIKDLLEQGVPIDGIGVQGHLHGESFDPAALQNALDELSQFGLPVLVTEFNFPGQNSKFYKEPELHKMSDNDREKQAQALVDYYRICFSHPSVEGILMWGFWEGLNWIPASSIYENNWNPTPALHAYRDLVFSEWWTDTAVKTDANGVAKVPAFYGDYEISIGNLRKQVKLQSSKGLAKVSFQ